MRQHPSSSAWSARWWVVAVVISAFVITLVGASPASAASAVKVTNPASGRCLDVAGNSTAARARIIIYDCKNQPNQSWTLTPAGELRVFGTMCLDVANRDTTSPAPVQTYPCNGGGNQQWRFAANGSLVGVQSGLCLDVTGAGATANRTVVGMWTCNGQSNQKWAQAAIGADLQPPTVPGNPRVSALTCTTVGFAWNPSTDNVKVTSYDVYHDGQLLKSVNGDTLSTSLTVVAGATWGLYVNARDAAGYVSQASSTVSITPPPCQADASPPTAPKNLVASSTGTSVTLSWTAASDNIGVRAYDVFRGGVKVGGTSGTATVAPATTFIDSGLAANTGYSYYVVARDAQANVSAHSNSVTATTGAACGSSVCTVRQVTTDTDIPWGLVPLPDGTVAYSRRDAHDVIHLNPVTGAKTNLGTVPNVSSTDGEGGLLGLAVSASFSTDHWLYIMHTTATDNRIVRIKYENDKINPSTEQILLSGILRNKYHDGGRLRFGPDGKLYASTGDAQNGDYAQDKSSLNGKVLRLNPDGGVPSDNPFGNYVWSYGHRNPQGLAFDSRGQLWEQEFGNMIMDETNLITKGGNYGWPKCEGTTGACGTAGYLAPKHTYVVSDGSCSGIAIVRDVLYVACQRGTRLYREVISGGSLTNVQSYLSGTYGRLRTVEPALDGGLWLTTTNAGDKDSTPNNSNEKILHVTLGG